MNRDMSFGIEIVGCPTVREKDGLAKSSRNSYLSKSERAAAAVIYKAVKAAQELIGSLKEDGKEIESRLIIETMEDIISKEPMARIDYIEAVDGMSLLPAEYLNSGDLVAVAVYVGNTRLIDNFTL